MEVSNKFVFILIFLFEFLWDAHGHESAEAHSRKARHLVFPPDGGASKIQLISGFGIPIQLPFQAITLGYVIKNDYYLPDNGTMFTKPFEAFATPPARKKRDATKRDATKRDATSEAVPSDRWDIYALLETFAHRTLSIGRLPGSIGMDAGRQCILRAICEAASSGIHHDGLLGELLHIILTPSTTSEPMTSKHHIDYHVAERIGRSAESFDTCGAVFGACYSGALDLITKLVSEF